MEEKGTRGQVSGESDEEDDQNFRVKAKPKSINDILADSDEENDAIMGDSEENDDRNIRKHKKNKKKHQAYIAEDGGKAIVDFLDPSAAQNVTTTMPKTQSLPKEESSAKSRVGGFQIAKDGRLIIEDSDSDADTPREKKLHFMESDGSDNEGKIYNYSMAFS